MWLNYYQIVNNLHPNKTKIFVCFPKPWMNNVVLSHMRLRKIQEKVNMCNLGLIKNVNMMTSSNGNIFRVTGPLYGEFTGPGEFPTQRPVTRSFDVFFDLRLNKRLSNREAGDLRCYRGHYDVIVMNHTCSWYVLSILPYHCVRGHWNGKNIFWDMQLQFRGHA